MKTITYKGTVYSCPLTRHFRRHTPDEVAIIKESLREHGFLNDIILYSDDDLDLDNCILDGEGRLESAADLGDELSFEAGFEHLGEMPTADAYSLAKGYNDARRQDDPKEIRKRRVEKVAELRSAGHSLRDIADQTGVTKTQVERDIEEAILLSRPGTVEPPSGTVVGQDGKKRSAKGKGGPKKKGEATEPAPTTQSSVVGDEPPRMLSPISPPSSSVSPPETFTLVHPEEELPRDRWGRVIPKCLRDLFECGRDAVGAVTKSLSEATSALKKLAVAEELGKPIRRRPDLASDLARISGYLRLRILPYCVCPGCGGDGNAGSCPPCLGSGWLSRSDWSRLSTGLQREARSHGKGDAWEADEPDTEADSTPERVLAAPGIDAAGQPIPRQLLDLFEPDWLLEFLHVLKRYAPLLRDAGSRDWWMPPKTHEAIASLIIYLEQDTLPSVVCRRCGGKGEEPVRGGKCDSCHGMGYHPQSSEIGQFNQPYVPPEEPKKKKGGKKP